MATRLVKTRPMTAKERQMAMAAVQQWAEGGR